MIAPFDLTENGNESPFYNTLLVLIDAYECDTSSVNFTIIV